MELFKLFGTIAIEGAKKAEDVIDQVSEKAESLGTSIRNVGEKLSSFGSSLTAKVSLPLAGIGVASVKAAADVKAANSQFEQTFGDMQAKASEAMKGVADDANIMESRLQGIGTSIYAFAKASGADSAEALALMETALKATADGAAYYDRSLEDTAESLQSFMKGNYENDAALGLSATETTRNAAAMELFGQKFNDLSEIQKQQTLLKMVTDAQQLSGAMGQAARESDGFENTIGNLKESARLLGAEFGEVLLPTVIDLMKGATELLKSFNNMDDGTKKLILTIGGIAIAVGPVLSVFGKVVTGIGAIIKVGGPLIAGIAKLSGGVVSLIGTGGKLLTGIVSIGGKITGLLIPALTAIGPVGLVIIAVIGSLIAAGVALYKNWDEVCAWASKTWNAIKETIGAAVDAIGGFFENLIESAKQLKDNIAEKFSEMRDNVTSRVEELKAKASAKFNELKENVVAKAEELKEKAAAKIEEMKEKAVSKFNELKDKAEAKVEELKEKAVSKFEDLKEKATAKVEELKEKAVSRFEELKEKATEKLTSMQEKGVEIVEGLKSKALEGFENLKSGALERFDNLKAGITDKLEAVKSFVGDAVQRLKDFFKFDWDLPKIKLPHFSIDGEFSLNPPSIPSFGIEWYKDGGIMNDPTVFGFNPFSGKAMVGGEAGAEAIAPIDTLKAYVREAVSESNDKLYTVMNAVLSVLSQYLPELANMRLVMDTGETVGALAPAMNEELGRIAYMRGRTN